MEIPLPSLRQSVRFALRLLLALDLAFLAVCAIHSAFDYVNGGWPAVEGWYVHLQIESDHLGSAGWHHYWTWTEALRPELLYAAALPVLWAAIRFLRPPDSDGVTALESTPEVASPLQTSVIRADGE